MAEALGIGNVLPVGAYPFADGEHLLEAIRQILGASIGQFASNSTLVFFLTWFPTYLATERHMGWIKVGFAAVLPFIVRVT